MAVAALGTRSLLRSWLCTAGPAVLAVLVTGAAQAQKAPAPQATLDADLQLVPLEMPQSCGSAEQGARTLLAAYEATIEQTQRDASRKHVAADADRLSEVRRWSDFAAAVLLQGDGEMAAWAALTGIAADWQAEYVANAGIVLAAVGRPADALPLLTCARDSGFRSPYLFEALAAAHAELGDTGAAREAIGVAQDLAPEDPMIELESSVLSTGEGPQRPPLPEGPLDRCIADLEDKARRVLATSRARNRELDRLTGMPSRVEAFAGKPQIFEQLIQYVRQLADAARQSGDVIMFNTTLGQCVSAYQLMADDEFSGVLGDRAMSIPFWAQVVRLEPMTFVRDIAPEPDRMLIDASRLTSARVDKEYQDGQDEASRQWYRDIEACGTNACREAWKRKECETRYAHYDRMEGQHRQRIAAAAANFDHVALATVRWAEAEMSDVRDFVARTLQGLQPGGPEMVGADGGKATSAEFTAQGIVAAYQSPLLEMNLGSGGRLESFLAEQVRFFEQQRAWAEDMLASTKQNLDDLCWETMNREMLEALAAEEWRQRQQELWDDMMANVEASYSPRFKCEGEIDGFGVEVDSEGAAFSSKFEKFKTALDSTGKLKFSGSWKYKGVGVAPRVTVEDGTITAVGVGGSVSAPPFTAKGSVTLAADHNRAAGRAETSLSFGGTVSIGVNVPSLGGVSCEPGNGKFKVYPRSFVESAVRYALASRD
jgi:hypothetical protein